MAILLLLLLGNSLEMQIGARGVLLLYFGGSLFAAIALLIVAGSSAQPFTGSFNAVSAITGGYFMLQKPLVQKYWFNLSGYYSRILQMLALWFAINIAFNLYTPLEQMIPLIASSMGAFAYGCLAAQPIYKWITADNRN
ncbi:MAG: rhomboid family intramembrane serine protease [Sphingomonadales bacterium]|nr:rhomboid family intramembrane serine protease [Sphingomonadales bacterium]